MTAEGRKVRVEFTPLEAEAAASLCLAAFEDPTKRTEWSKFEKRRGKGVASSALRRAADKLREETKNG